MPTIAVTEGTPSPAVPSHPLHAVLRRCAIPAVWTAVIAIGAVRLYWTRFTIYPDAVSYLDLAAAMRDGQWAKGITSYWSLLYPALIAAVLRVTHPMRWHEVAAAHAANFCIFLAGAIAFAFFWRNFLKELNHAAEDGPGGAPFSWSLIGCALYAYTAMTVCTLPNLSPDLLVEALLLTAAALVLKIKPHRPLLRPMLFLGIVLGLGYMAKAVVLPLALVFIVVAGWRTGNARRALSGVVLAVLALGVISAPYVYAMSRHKGRLTFGDVGHLAYAWYVSWHDMPASCWRGLPPGSGTPVHPIRVIYSSPEVLDFSSADAGTYPLWFDPAYWNEGLKAPFRLRRQLSVLASNVAKLLKRTMLDQREITLCFAFLLFYIGRRRLAPPGALLLMLVIFAAAGFGIYSLVLVEQRYLLAFYIFLWAAALAYAAPALRQDRRLLRAFAACLVLAVMAVNALAIRYEYEGRNNKDEHVATAEALLAAGIRPGERVGVIGDGWDAGWARIAGVRITAQVPEHEPGMPVSPVATFWAADEKTRAAALEAMRATGVRAVVSMREPSLADHGSWKRLSGEKFLLVF